MTGIRSDLIESARSRIGEINYMRHKSPSRLQDPARGLNCYGFIRFVMTENGIYAPNGIREMWEQFELTDNPQTADLLFQNGRYHDRPSHVGFYDPAAGTIIHLSKYIGTVAETRLEEMVSIMGFRSIEPCLRGAEHARRLQTNA